MGGCRYRVLVKKWPGPQTGVHLREVSTSGGSTVFATRLVEVSPVLSLPRPTCPSLSPFVLASMEQTGSSGWLDGCRIRIHGTLNRPFRLFQ